MNFNIEKIAINYFLFFPESLDEAVFRGIDSSFFTNKIISLSFSIMTKYRREYKSFLNKTQLLLELNKLGLEKEIEDIFTLKSDDLIDITVEWLIKNLFEYKKRNYLTMGVNKIVEAINSNDIDQAEKNLINMYNYVNKLKPIKSLVVDLNEETNYINSLVENNTKIIKKRVMSGYKEIDNVLNGFLPGELVVVAARPKVGKTRTIVNLVSNMIRDKHNVLVFSLEVPRDQYISLFYSCLSGVQFMKFKTGIFFEEDIQKIKNIQEELKNNYGKLVIVDTINAVTPEYIRNKIEEIETQYSTTFDVIAIDHATMMKPTRSFGDDWLDQGSIASELRDIGREKEKVMLTALQIRRGISLKKDKEPGDELARSDIWFQVLDVLLALSKTESSDENYVSTLKIKVQPRHGESIEVTLIKDFSVTALYSISDKSKFNLNF